MHIGDSHVSCGINELIIKPDEKVTKTALHKLIFAGANVCSMLVANVDTSHKKTLKLLENNKFKCVGSATVAGGKEYAFVVRRFSREEIALMQRNYKKRYPYY